MYRMEDLIKRSDAIEAIELVDWYHQNRNKDIVSGANSREHQAWYKAEDIYKALEAVPAAKPKRGKWIDISEWYAPRQKCSICETVVDGYGSNFCPNCGADMREREGE